MADHGWTPGAGQQPLPPMNGSVASAYQPGVLDIRWDDPAILAGNAAFQVVGVNLYRSDTSDRGPYFRLNEFPVGAGFYRDRTDNVQISREVVDWGQSWIARGNAPNNCKWLFRTRHPIVKRIPHAPYSTPTAANAPTDVTVWVNGTPVEIEAVFGPSGEVTLVNVWDFDVGTERSVAPTLPSADVSVEITYYANRNHVQGGLDTHLFYRLTTVVVDATTPSGYRETDLTYCEPLNDVASERLDYIWREAVRRNNWILEQAGERVKFFIRKTAGVRCFCGLDPATHEYGQQASQRCLICYGTGFVGGYEGPYDAIVAPDEAEHRISQTPTGRRREHTYEVFMGPTPVVTMRDFLVKQTNERFSIGAVRRPTARGNFMQQHFTIGAFDESDLRYAIPIDGTEALFATPATRYGYPPAPAPAADGALPTSPPYPVGPDAINPMVTEKSNVPDEKEERGRSPVWENIQY